MISIDVLAVGLVVFAVFVAGLIALVINSVQRKHRNAPQRVAEKVPEADKALEKEHNESEPWPIALGVGLGMFALICVLSVAKGMGLGATGKGVSLLGMVLILSLVWGVVVAIKHRHGKVLLSLGLILIVAAGAVTTAWRNASLAQERANVASKVSELNVIAAEWSDGQAEGDPLAGMAQPKIRLENDIDTEPSENEAEPTTETATDADADGVEADQPDDGAPVSDEEPLAPDDLAPLKASDTPLPDWATAAPAANQKVVASDPYPTVGGAREHAEELFAEWLEQRIDRQTPGSIELRYPIGETPQSLRERFVTSEHVQRRDSSVGEVYIVRLLAEIDLEGEQKLLQVAKDFSLRQRQEKGVVAVTATGGGVLVCLAALYGLLSYGGEKRA